MKFPDVNWRRFERPSSEKINAMFSALVEHSERTATGFINPGTGFEHWAAAIQVDGKEFPDLQSVVTARTTFIPTIFDKKMAVVTIAPEALINHVKADYYFPGNPLTAAAYMYNTVFQDPAFSMSGPGGILYWYAGTYKITDGTLFTIASKKIHMLGESAASTRIEFNTQGSSVGGFSAYNYVSRYPTYISGFTFFSYGKAYGIFGDHLRIKDCVFIADSTGRTAEPSTDFSPCLTIRTGGTGYDGISIIEDCDFYCAELISSGNTESNSYPIVLRRALGVVFKNIKILPFSAKHKYFRRGIAAMANDSGSFGLYDSEIRTYRECILFSTIATDFPRTTVDNCSFYMEDSGTGGSRSIPI